MKRTMNRLFARLAILCVAVILGAIAVSQAQRGLAEQQGQQAAAETPKEQQTSPIPGGAGADAQKTGGTGFSPPTISKMDSNTGGYGSYQANGGLNNGGGTSQDYGDTTTYVAGDGNAHVANAKEPAYSTPEYDPTPPDSLYGSPGSYEREKTAAYDTQQNDYDEPSYDTDSLYGDNNAYGDAKTSVADNSAYLDPPEHDLGASYAVGTPVTAEQQEIAGVGYDEATPPELPPMLPAVVDAAGSAAKAALDSLAPTAPATTNQLPPIGALPAMTPDIPAATVAATPTQPTELAPLTPVAPVSREVGYPAEQPTAAAAPTAITPIGGFDDNTGFDNNGGYNNGGYAAAPTTPTTTPPAIAPVTPVYGGQGGAATLSVTGERRTASSMNAFSNQPGFGSAGAAANAGPVGPTGSGKPGPSALEGPQTPTLIVTKNAPPEVQVGKVAKFEVTVRNVGAVDAQDVVIRDQVPQGAQLVETIPAAGKAADGSLVWNIGTVKAGGEVTVVMQIMPMNEGDIGSVATVAFQAAASAKSIATRPQLTLEHTGPGQVLVGNDVIFHIKLSNPGTGVANNVMVVEDVPPGLRHNDGRQLKYQIGTMHPGETRLLELTLKADQAGRVNNLLIAKADSNLRVEDNCPVDIVAPNIRIGIEGPRRRYLERRATFQIKVANPGTASAREVELIAQLPHGLKFVSTNNAGQYNSQEHTVRWSLPELPTKEMGVVELTCIPEEVGTQRIRAETRAQMGLTDTADHEVVVEGLSAILFTVTDASDPIEVGEQTTYDVRVVNQGSKIGSNVQLMAIVPAGMTPVNGEGPTRATVQGQNVIFDPLPRLAPQADALYKVHVKGNVAGDQRVVIQLRSDDVREPVSKEESTHVYSDQQ